MTRWLSGEEQLVWRSYLEATKGLFGYLEHQLQRDSGLSHAEYEVLVHLSEGDQHRLRMSDLAHRSQQSRSRLSHTVARMEASGWVYREKSDDDRRGTWAILTPAGHELLVEAAKGHVQAVITGLFDALTPAQLKVLAEVNAAVTKSVSAQ